MTTALPGLPARVEVYEVAPRDGLQNEAAVVHVGGDVGAAQVADVTVRLHGMGCTEVSPANTLVALQAGVTTVGARTGGGLGGGPYAGSATGNLATEDLVWQLHGLGIETGVDLTALARTSAWMAEQLGRPSPSRTLSALVPTLET